MFFLARSERYYIIGLLVRVIWLCDINMTFSIQRKVKKYITLPLPYWHFSVQFKKKEKKEWDNRLRIRKRAECATSAAAAGPGPGESVVGICRCHVKKKKGKVRTKKKKHRRPPLERLTCCLWDSTGEKHLLFGRSCLSPKHSKSPLHNRSRRPMCKTIFQLFCLLPPPAAIVLLAPKKIVHGPRKNVTRLYECTLFTAAVSAKEFSPLLYRGRWPLQHKYLQDKHIFNKNIPVIWNV